MNVSDRNFDGTMEDSAAIIHAQRLADTLRRYRKATNQSLGELSRTTGLSKTSLARIENAEANPSLETLWRLGRALNLSIGQLLEEPETGSPMVLRSGEGPVVRSSFGMHGRLLQTDARAHRTEVFELDLPAGAHFEGEPHPVGTREVVYCVSGIVRSGPADDPTSLEAGDTILFDGNTPHIYAAGADGGRAVLVMSYPMTSA